MKRFLLSLAGILGVTVMALAADKVEEGKPAPMVELSAASKSKEAKVNLADFKGKKNVVLFFYPKAMTGGCTKESCGFSGLVEKFAKLDTVIFGISTDTVELQQKFVEKEKLEIPLLADPEKKVTTAFGALSKSGMASRYTYVIDKEGVVKKIYTTVKPDAHPQEVLDYIKANLK